MNATTARRITLVRHPEGMPTDQDLKLESMPLPKAAKRLRVKLCRACRSWEPNARMAPVRTNLTAQISSATPPARWIRMLVALSVAIFVRSFPDSGDDRRRNLSIFD